MPSGRCNRSPPSSRRPRFTPMPLITIVVIAQIAKMKQVSCSGSFTMTNGETFGT
jgi:hypothetical protein